MKNLNLTDEMVLWAIWRLGENAYGVTIRRLLSTTTGRLFHYGTLYGALAKLKRQHLIIKIVGDPLPVRGGRSKNYYRISGSGLEALRSAASLKQSLWNEEALEALFRN